MKRNFFNENFEKFLKENADQYRMYPSEKVWKGVVKDLNKRRRWLGFTFGAFLLVASLFGYYVVENNSSVSTPASSNSSDVVYNEKEAGNESISSSGTSGNSPDQSVNTFVKTPLVSTNTKVKTQNSTKPSPIFINNVDQAPVEKSSTVETISIINNKVTSIDEKETATLTDLSADETSSSVTETVSVLNETEPLLTIESVSNLYKAPIKKSKITYQLYFTPTVSYRKLTENKSYLRSVPQAVSNPGYSALYDIKNAVTHKPDIGLELGFTAKYPITNIIKVRGGIQFNINRYDIKAFNYSPEVATIALNGGSRGNSVRTVTSYRNFNGYQANWLQNFYFQVSAPIGLEIRLKGSEKTHFGVASTVQPTYVLGERAYLLSSDYKNYSEVPWLIRRWNANTNLEAFVSYSTGKLKWQVGPQVRYQLLSSFVTEYPVKENLFDYGLKVGISLNKQP